MYRSLAQALRALRLRRGLGDFDIATHRSRLFSGGSVSTWG